MKQYDIQVRPSLSAAEKFLLEDFPRENWSKHPNFGHFTRYWLDSHQMFRQLTSSLTKLTEDFLSNNCSDREFSNVFAQNGNYFLSQLHNHHSIEDHGFFPEIRSVDDRFSSSLEILEKDHIELSELLSIFAKTGNQTINLMAEQESDVKSETGTLHETLLRIGKNLDRHLTDEEDLIMPILLLHKMRH